MPYNFVFNDIWSGNDLSAHYSDGRRLPPLERLDSLMYISELGKHAGASPKAIRLYEAMGLLGTVPRQGAYRIYSDDHVRQVRLIRQAQTLGFRLAEIAPLLKSDGHASDWAQLAHYLERKRVQIRAEISRLKQLDGQLGSILVEIASCERAVTGADTAHCDMNKA